MFIFIIHKYISFSMIDEFLVINKKFDDLIFFSIYTSKKIVIEKMIDRSFIKNYRFVFIIN